MSGENEETWAVRVQILKLSFAKRKNRMIRVKGMGRGTRVQVSYRVGGGVRARFLSAASVWEMQQAEPLHLPLCGLRQ